MATLVQRIWGVFDAVQNSLLGVTTSGEAPYYPLTAGLQVYGALLVDPNSHTQNTVKLTTSIQVNGYANSGDGGGGLYALNTADTSSGWFGTATITGTALTLLTTTNGAMAIGLSVWAPDGTFLGFVTSGAGSSWVVSIGSIATLTGIMSADSPSQYLVTAPSGARWDLVSGGGAPVPAEIAASTIPVSYAYPPQNVRRYGADPSGVGDSTQAFQNAVNAGGARPSTVRVPGGAYKISAPVSVTQPVTLLGDGPTSSVIVPTTTNGAVFNVNTSDVTFRSLAIDDFGLGQVNGSVYIHFQSSSALCYIEDCYFIGWYTGVEYEGGNSMWVTDTQFANGIPANGTAILVGAEGGVMMLEGCNITNPDAAHAPYTGLYFAGAGNVNINCVDCSFIWCQHGVALEPSSGVVADTQFVNCYFDHCVYHGALLAPTSTGAIVRTVFDTCWFGSTQGDGISEPIGLLCSTGGGGSIDSVICSNCQFASNSETHTGLGAWFTGSTTQNIIVTGGWAAGNDTGLAFDAGALYNAVITGFRAGPVGALTGNTSYGIHLLPGVAPGFVLTDCNLAGNTIAGLADATTGTLKLIKGIYPAPGQTNISVSASPFSWQNTTGAAVVVSISSGTVSAVTLNSAQVYSATNVAVTVPHGATLVVTYSGLPTLFYVSIN
jgi:Pectate lyase superfamily protein